MLKTELVKNLIKAHKAIEVTSLLNKLGFGENIEKHSELYNILYELSYKGIIYFDGDPNGIVIQKNEVIH